MHLYEGHFWGMHIIWWIIWVIFLFWIFFTPWDVPGQKTRKKNPLDILKKRLATGEITTEEFNEKKNLLKKNNS